MAQTIMGIYVTERMEKTTELQKVLSKHGCIIKTRIGLHDASKEICSPAGVVILDLIGSTGEVKNLCDDVKKLNLDVKTMSFE